LKCRELEPGLKLILWSGFGEETLAALLAEVPVVPDARVPKPCKIEQLIETVGEVLKAVPGLGRVQ
jgi:hypothetical protein